MWLKGHTIDFRNEHALFEAGSLREKQRRHITDINKTKMENQMKSLKLATVTICVLALIAPSGLMRASAQEKKACCEATVEAGKKCKHDCCKKAAEDGKVCEKCHPKKDEKK